MSCNHDCTQPPVFPAAIFNRPGLDRIGYRIGDYTRFREHGLARLDAALALAGWTHRGADDPGIALLECGAIAGELLAFYQELYANEIYLRTADWRESVGRLVALTGYRLAPGLGGTTAFALTISGDAPVTVPAGFPFKADLEALDSPARFEAVEEVVAYPWLNRLSLYRRRKGPATISRRDRVLELQAVGGETALRVRQALTLVPGDRIMLVPDSSMFEAGGGGNPTQQRSETLVVDRVETILDRVCIHFRGAVTIDRGATVRAYKIGRSFRHFGHNAPIRIAALNEVTGRATFNTTVFNRVSATSTGLYSQFAANELALESGVDDLAAGSDMIVSGAAEFGGLAGEKEFAVVNRVDAVQGGAARWAGLAGGSTAVRLRDQIFSNASLSLAALDVRRLQAHEVKSPALTLAAHSTFQDGDFGTEAVLTFFGRHEHALALAGRALLLEDENGDTQQVRVANTAEDFDPAGRDPEENWLWTLALDQPPRFPREQFDEADPRITVHGNLVLADQGESQKEAAIGSGDARETFQTFKIPKAPLTYHLHAGRIPAQAPELEVWVDGILWSQVDTFFASGPNDRVYIVREDDEGNSHIQFGDGLTGARLPSGRQNVKVLFRTGNGARGELKEGAPKAIGRLRQLSDVAMPASAVNGAEPETEEVARDAAPLRMQSLGRLVGLADYEAEALSLPGVHRASAAWVLTGGLPRLSVVVLTDGGGDAEAAAIAQALAAADRCRGSGRFPLEVVHGVRRFLFLDVTAGYQGDRLPETLESEIREALGVAAGATEPADGLFGFAARRFGQDAHVSQVIGAIQNVDGIAWVRLDAFQPLAQGTPPETDPLAIPAPMTPLRHEAVGCEARGLLALHETHLRLSLARVANAEECG